MSLCKSYTVWQPILQTSTKLTLNRATALIIINTFRSRKRCLSIRLVSYWFKDSRRCARKSRTLRYWRARVNIQLIRARSLMTRSLIGIHLVIIIKWQQTSVVNKSRLHRTQSRNQVGLIGSLTILLADMKLRFNCRKLRDKIKG